MPRETLARLSALGVPVQCIHGNGELELLAQLDAPRPEDVAYWGTTGGSVLPDGYREWIRWTARQLQPEETTMLRRLAKDAPSPDWQERGSDLLPRHAHQRNRRVHAPHAGRHAR